MKKTLLTIILAFIGFSNVINAQAPNYLWAKTSSCLSYGRSIGIDSNGNSYVVGSFGSSIGSPIITFGTTTLANSGLLDIYIVKYDPNGNIIWAKSAGGTGNDYAIGVAVDNNGNSYVTGNFDSPSITFGTTTLTNPNIYDEMYAVKYDTDGNVVWAKSAGGSVRDFGKAIAVDTIGNSYVTGYFISPTITFGTITLTNTNTYEEMYIVKYDANGNVVWAKLGAGTGFDQGSALAVDTSGNIYVTGWFGSTGISFGSTFLTSTGGVDIFLVKYDTDGNVIWAKKAGGAATLSDNAFGIAVDANNNCYVTGSFTSPTITFGSSTLTNGTPGLDDMFVMKFNAVGNPVWAKSAGGTYYDKGKSVAIDASGNCYVTGFYASTSITFGSTTLNNISEGNMRLFIVKYNPSGGVDWAKSSDDINDGIEREMAITTDASGHSFVAGTFLPNNLTLGSTVLHIPAQLSMFVTKLDNAAPGNAPLSAFTANVTNINVGGSVNFTDLSSNAPTSWSWTFNGATTLNSTDQNPTNITYNTAGCYAVILTTTNDAGSNTSTQTCYISVGNTAPNCNELFFSEYLEGTASNKALEIYNPSDIPKNLSSYSVELYANGSATPTAAQNLSGTIAAHGVYVLANAAAVAGILSLANSTSSVCNFNGDDAVVLKNGTTIIDSVGEIGVDPGTFWTVGTGSTLDYTLVRNPNVDAPTSNWATGQNQWTAYPVNTFSNLGQHSSNCGSLSTINYEVNGNDVKIVPNPTNGQLRVLSAVEITKITITDLNGRIINQSIFDGELDVKTDVSDLSKGVYLMKITSNQNTTIKKFIKN